MQANTERQGNETRVTHREINPTVLDFVTPVASAMTISPDRSENVRLRTAGAVVDDLRNGSHKAFV